MNPEKIGKDSFRPRISRGGIFFDPRRDIEPVGPSQQDIDRSNAVRGNLNGQEGKITAPVAISGGLFGVGIISGVGYVVVTEVFANPKTIDIGSVPGTSFGNDGSVPQIEGLPPNLELPKPPQSVSRPEKKVNPGEIFDNEATSGVITPNMIERIPEEAIQKLDTFGKLNKDGKKEIITLSQPKPLSPAEVGGSLPDIQFELGKDKNTLEILYPLELSQSSNPDATIEYIKSYIGSGTDRQAVQGKGYYDTFEFTGKGGSGIPKGTIVNMPVNGYLVIKNEYGHIYFQAPNGNKYSMLTFGEKGNTVVPFKLLVDAPEWTSEFNGKPIETFGLFGPKGQASLQTTQELDRIHVRIQVATKAVENPLQGKNVYETVYIPTNVILSVSPNHNLFASEQ